MLGWAVTFFVLAVIAAVLGFGGLASAFASIAQLLFWIFLVVLGAILIAHLVRGKQPPIA